MARLWRRIRTAFRPVRESGYIARSPRAPQDEPARWFTTREIRRNRRASW